MDRYVGEPLDRRYAEYRADSENIRSKAMIDLVLQAYIAEDAKSKPKELDPEFRAFATRQVRLFVFVGYDSTSSTICYILHLLSTNPATLALIRAEHDKVFGKDLKETMLVLDENHQLTNSLPYTTAIIKEALRMFPPASCSR